MSLVTILPERRRIHVSGNGTGPRHSTDGAEIVTGMPRNYLIPGHDYIFVVTGQVGAFFNNGTPTTFGSSAEVWCGLSDGRFYGDRHRVSMFAPNLFGPGDTTQRSHPFTFIFGVANLPSDVDFLMFARTWNRDGPNYSGAFQMDCITILAYDLTLLGPANYRLNSTSIPPRTLHYLHTAGEELVLSPTVDTPGTWLAYYTAECQPGSGTHAFNAWLDHLKQPTWGATNETWGHHAMGSTGRGGGNDIDKNSYSMGLWGVFGMQADHAFGVRARSSYEQHWGDSIKSTATRATIFAVRTAALPGFQYERAGYDGTDVYARGVGYEKYREWVQPAHMPGAVMVSGCPVSAGKSYALDIYFGAKRTTTETPLHVHVQNFREGIPEQRAGESPFYKGRNSIGIIGVRNPRDEEFRITALSGFQPPLSDISIITTGAKTRLVTKGGLWSSGTVTAAVQESNVPGLNGRWPGAVVINTNTVEIPFATSGTLQPSGRVSNDGYTDITVDRSHHVPDGKNQDVWLGFVGGNVPTLLGNYTAISVTGTKLRIPVVSTTYGRGGSLEFRGTVYKSRYFCLIGMGLNFSTATVLRAKELPGAEVQIVPSREAPNIYALPDLPYPPQEGAGVKIQAAVGELRNVYGDAITWPLATEVAEQMSFRWVLPATKADGLIEFFAGLGAGAFRTVLPREEVDGAPTAFVLLGAPIQQVDDGAGQRFTISVNAAKLRWIGP